MPSVTLAETQAIAEMADLLYPFLPGSGAKYTWREAAAQHGLERFWGSAPGVCAWPTTRRSGLTWLLLYATGRAHAGQTNLVLG